MERGLFAITWVGSLGGILFAASCGRVDPPPADVVDDPPELTVRIAEPTSGVVTNGTVAFVVEVSGDIRVFEDSFQLRAEVDLFAARTNI